MLLIKNGKIMPITGPILKKGCVLVGDDGKIAAVGADIPAPEGATVIDAKGKPVTPGLVEAHAHIGLNAEFMGGLIGPGNNETTDPLLPQIRALDGINPTDPSFTFARENGITTVCITPGSANIIGGTCTVLKTLGDCVDEMVIKDGAGMKCAFGENPKTAYGTNQKKAPKTRMAIAAMMRDFLYKAKQYQEDTDAGNNPKYDSKMHAMLPVMRREMPLKIHAHRADDIFTAIRICKEFDLKFTLDHCTDGALIADKLAGLGAPVLVGPSWGKRSKEELAHKSFSTPGALCNAGCEVSIITDANVVPIRYLALSAGLAVAEGLAWEDGWKAITINPAKALGVADRVGSLEPGKDADIVIWTADPLTAIAAKTYMTILDGKIVYKA